MALIAPSILSADFSILKEELIRLEKSNADWIHIDVMDGQFVPNLTFGAPIVKALRPVTKLPFDVHLMIENPENLVDDFIKAGADILTFHIEATNHAHRLATYIKSKNVECGIALNPATPIYLVEELLPYVDMVLIMTVNPGFGGQAYIPTSTDKILRMKEMIQRINPKVKLQVDGGITSTTSVLAKNAGSDILVAGSAVFNAANMEKAIANLK